MFNAQCSNVHESAWLSRFLSPDPFVQTPTHSQSYNRYSYCLNNPLKYTDPSGYKQKPFFEWEMNYFNSGASLVFSRPDISSLYLPGSMGYTYVGNNEYIDKASGETVGYETVFNNYILPAQNKESGNSESTDIVNLYFPRQTPVLTNKYIPGAIKWNVDGSTWYVFGFTTIYTSRNFEVATGGGGIDPSITAGIAVGGGMINGLEQSYKYGNHNVKYAQRVNGKVRTPSVLTRANQMNATKMASGLKVVGRGVTGLSVAASGYQFLNSDMSGNDYARLSGSLIITGTAFIPIVGPIISIGLGVADSYGAFDGIYNYFD
jgi:hypothetical protein